MKENTSYLSIANNKKYAVCVVCLLCGGVLKYSIVLCSAVRYTFREVAVKRTFLSFGRFPTKLKSGGGGSVGVRVGVGGGLFKPTRGG